MVDHRAEDHGSFSLLTGSGASQPWEFPGSLAKARGWVGGLLDNGARDAITPTAGFWSDRVRTGRLAIGICLIWVSILAAYGFGFFSQASAVQGGVNAIPTLNLLFFAFAVIGPVVMIWFVAAMMNRAEQLSEVITGQSESVLALAATINNLNDSLDEMSSFTSGRMAQACNRMESGANASIGRLESALRATSEKLDATLMDSVILMDNRLRERAETLSDRIDEQHQSVKQAIGDDLLAIRQTASAEPLAESAQRLARLETQIGELLRQIGNTAKAEPGKSGQPCAKAGQDDHQTGWLFDDLPVQARSDDPGRNTPLN